MKPGDRVRVLRGPHEGRTGRITDVSARRQAVDAVLKPSELRTRLLAKLDVPADHRAVQLDHDAPRDMGRMDSLEIIPANFLMVMSGPLVSGRMELDEFLNQLEAKAHAAPVGVWRGPGVGSRYGEVVSDAGEVDEGYGGHLICESVRDAASEHILATQPKVVLALVAKLRAAVQLAKDLSVEMCESRNPPMDPVGLAHLEVQIETLTSIEVP